MRFAKDFVALVFALSTTTLAVDEHTDDLIAHDDSIDVSDRYIISLKPDVKLAEHLNFVNELRTESANTNPTSRPYAGVTHQYSIPNFLGYAAHLSPSTIAHLRAHTAISSIEPDTLWTTGEMTEQPNAGYALALISHRSIVMPNWDTYPHDTTAGEGTVAYVLDSGVHTGADDFSSRAKRGYNAVDPTKPDSGDDCGQGTHVAGLVAGERFGVAKKAELIAVKVVKFRNGPLATILAGYQWAVKNILDEEKTGKAVVLVSLYGEPSTAFNKAVDGAAGKGITTVVSAGNSGTDDPTSPGMAKGAITVSATDEARRRASWANHGREVDIYAPGVGILSTWIRGTNRVRKASGTAQAAAFVAGLVLYFKAIHELPDAKATKEFLLGEALKDVVPEPQLKKKKPFAYNGSGQ
ncbi:subtilisin-like protein [Myriangium duriaei CBS 260.36]|uniref:Subtilisin-like protein n=1 Tax=Myriangium duriaei CBS 260.36 TaxID=1168546 RepID=A0A9P4IZE2_9PEZI|nr:subtilisin-like protein [Myriangium duriaei CBS 260.36]